MKLISVVTQKVKQITLSLPPLNLTLAHTLCLHPASLKHVPFPTSKTTAVPSSYEPLNSLSL